MNIFVAGASGALGMPIVMTRSESGSERLAISTTTRPWSTSSLDRTIFIETSRRTECLSDGAALARCFCDMRSG